MIKTHTHGEMNAGGRRREGRRAAGERLRSPASDIEVGCLGKLHAKIARRSGFEGTRAERWREPGHVMHGTGQTMLFAPRPAVAV